MTETTIADRLAEVLKMLRSDWSPGGMERRDDGDWVDYNAMCPAVLTLIHTLLREERERCASQWREVYEIPMRDRIRALEDRP